jgi:hypothetical protein
LKILDASIKPLIYVYFKYFLSNLYPKIGLILAFFDSVKLNIYSKIIFSLFLAC